MSTFRVPVLAGNTLHRDHTLWKLITWAEATDGLPRPVGFTYKQFIAMAWRCKKFHLTGSQSFSAERFVFGATFHNQWAGGAIDRLASSGSLNERDVAFFQRAWAVPQFGTILVPATVTSWVNTGTHLVSSGSYGFSLLIGQGGFTVYDPSTKLFYPVILCDSEFSDNVAAAGGAITTFTVNSVPPGAGGAGNLTIVLGVEASVVVPLYSFPASTGIASGGSALTFSAIEFWPFADSTGAPVYDTASGAQLADPFG